MLRAMLKDHIDRCLTQALDKEMVEYEPADEDFEDLISRKNRIMLNFTMTLKLHQLNV